MPFVRDQAGMIGRTRRGVKPDGRPEACSSLWKQRTGKFEAVAESRPATQAVIERLQARSERRTFLCR